MIRWIKRLLEDANGLPSSRLCISWLLTGLVIWKAEILDETKLGLLLTAITTMTSVSVIDKVKPITGTSELKKTLSTFLIKYE